MKSERTPRPYRHVRPHTQRRQVRPTHRARWTDADIKELHRAIGIYHSQYSEIQRAIERGEFSFEVQHPDWQTAIRSKARMLKTQYIL